MDDIRIAEAKITANRLIACGYLELNEYLSIARSSLVRSGMSKNEIEEFLKERTTAAKVLVKAYAIDVD